MQLPQGVIHTGDRIDLPKVLDDKQVQSYVEDGYLAVLDLVSADDREELKQDMVRIARGEYPCEQIEPMPDATEQQVLASVLCIHHPHSISPVVRRFVGHADICGVLSQITGAHLPWWDGSVKCMQSMLFVKPPGFQGQAWHQDEIYIPTRDRSLVGAWIAIDDATVENGCLWVLPGSHRNGYLYPQRSHDNFEEFDVALESYGFDDAAEMPVQVKAGTVVFFNGYLLHRSRKNRGDTYRRVLVNHYMNAWSLLPWYSLDDEKNGSVGVARADQRAIVSVAGIDPHAWKGTQSPKQVYIRHCKANDPDE